jgi:hypothetical protein
MTTGRINQVTTMATVGLQRRAVYLKAAASEKKPRRSILTSLEFVIPIWLSVVRECLQQLRTGSHSSADARRYGITSSIQSASSETILSTSASRALR